MRFKKLAIIVLAVLYIILLIPNVINEIKDLLKFGYNISTNGNLGTLPFEGYDETKGYIVIILNLFLIISTVLVLIKSSKINLILFFGWNVPAFLLLLYYQLKYLSKGYEFDGDKWKIIFTSAILLSLVCISYFGVIKNFTRRQYTALIILVIFVFILLIKTFYN